MILARTTWLLVGLYVVLFVLVIWRMWKRKVKRLRAELDNARQIAQQQSTEAQHNWLGPAEAEKLRQRLAEVETDLAETRTRNAKAAVALSVVVLVSWLVLCKMSAGAQGDE